MQRGKRLLMAVVVVGITACGSPDTSFGGASDLESTSSTSETSTPAEGQSSTETMVASGQDPASTTFVTQASPTTTLAEPPVSTTTSGTSGPYDPALQPYVDQAITDLASRLGDDSSSITVISAEIVVWPDAALGCPQPGMAYIQVPVDGSLIKLSASGVEYHYHTGGRVSTPFLCENQK